MVTTEDTAGARTQSILAKVGWAVLLAISALLVFHGATWFFEGPEQYLSNIAERTSLAPNEFKQGEPSAFDIMTLIARQFAIDRAALGLLLLLAAWEGYRRGSRRAWMATWVLVAMMAAVAGSFILAGGISGIGLGFLGLAAVALVGQLLAGKGLSAKADAG